MATVWEEESLGTQYGREKVLARKQSDGRREPIGVVSTGSDRGPRLIDRTSR